MLAALDALAFSSTWVACAAGALCAASGLALGVAPDAAAIGLAICGTLVVYNVDRLRDLDRDRATSPRRSAFVDRNRGFLRGLTAFAALASAAFAVAFGEAVLPLLAPVLALGLLHRRLKRFGLAKPLYITLAWVAVVVGLPAVRAPSLEAVPWVVGVLAPTVLANAIASNVRDDESVTARLGPKVPLHIARACAALGLLAAALGPPAVLGLSAAPFLTLVALVSFRPQERYGLLVVDGALLAGGLVGVAFA